MKEWRIGAALQVADAADVGGKDHVRPAGGNRAQLAVPQLQADLGIQHGIGARRAAAQVLVGERLQLEAQVGKQLLR
ncbi:hypothetical protein D3C78_1884320 [compost metagenome]